VGYVGVDACPPAIFGDCMKTQKEIEIQITQLKEIQEKVRPASFFGDSHLDAIDAQIKVLEEDMDNDDIEDEFESGELNVLTAALDTREWIDGESEIDNLATDYPLT